MCIILPKPNAYIKSNDGKTKWMYFLIEGHELTKKYDIWHKVSKSLTKNLVANPSTIKNF